MVDHVHLDQQRMLIANAYNGIAVLIERVTTKTCNAQGSLEMLLSSGSRNVTPIISL